MRNIFRRTFQGLRWKLTWPYMVFAPLIMTIIIFIGTLAAIAVIVLFFMPNIVHYTTEQTAIAARPFFVGNTPDREALDLWMQMYSSSFESYATEASTFVDRQGTIVFSYGTRPLTLDTSIYEQVPKNVGEILQQVLSEQHTGLAQKTGNDAIFAVLPITHPDGRLLGALIENTGPDLSIRESLYWISYYVPILLISAIFYCFFGLVVGIVSSTFTTRRLIQRFNRLTTAADKWSTGDFSVTVQDSEQDEIGQLTRSFNRMAEQIQNLLYTHQKLAALEERHRLARDLHDSIKQHIFVVSLQLGSARLRLRENIDISEQSLLQAEKSLQQTQSELKTLIRELRPIALEKGLIAAIKEHIRTWQAQTDMVIDTNIASTTLLPPLVEEAFFRLLQEALANVARHSQASKVQIRIYEEQGIYFLTIADNGRGFDVAQSNQEGFGLRSMQDRIQGIGGTLRIESTPGQGTQISAQYHLTEEQQETV